MTENNYNANAERFTGFGALYDQNRPKAPEEVVNILVQYLGRKPQQVVDVGCGTGLSTFLWLGASEAVIGAEPNDDMRKVAVARFEAESSPSSLQFIKALSHELPLESRSTDIITCSQSFHWMEPESTLKEFARILKPGGVFAAYDYDWPPALNWELEQTYLKLNTLADTRALELAPEETKAERWSKNDHLKHIRKSGLFRYSREIVFHNRELCDAERFINLACSQSGLQMAVKLGADDVEEALAEFREQAHADFHGETREILFGYRMRLGVK